MKHKPRTCYRCKTIFEVGPGNIGSFHCPLCRSPPEKPPEKLPEHKPYYHDVGLEWGPLPPEVLAKLERLRIKQIAAQYVHWAKKGRHNNGKG